MAVKAYKFRIYPDPEQLVLLERTFGCTRYIYNKLLEQSSQAYQAYKADNSLPKPNRLMNPRPSGLGECQVFTFPLLKKIRHIYYTR